MSLRTVGTTVGVGLTTLFIVGALVTTVAERFIEFSLFVGIPAGVLVGVIVMVGVYAELNGRPTKGTENMLMAIAVFGYLVILLWVLQYAIAAVREILSVFVIIGLSAILAIAVYAYLKLTVKTYSPMEG